MTITDQRSVIARKVESDVDTLYQDGIVARKGAFSRAWTEQLRQDMLAAFWEAIQRPGGAVGRGPRRWYMRSIQRRSAVSWT